MGIRCMMSRKLVVDFVTDALKVRQWYYDATYGLAWLIYNNHCHLLERGRSRMSLYWKFSWRSGVWSDENCSSEKPDGEVRKRSGVVGPGWMCSMPKGGQAKEAGRAEKKKKIRFSPSNFRRISYFFYHTSCSLSTERAVVFTHGHGIYHHCSSNHALYWRHFYRQ